MSHKYLIELTLDPDENDPQLNIEDRPELRDRQQLQEQLEQALENSTASEALAYSLNAYVKMRLLKPSDEKEIPFVLNHYENEARSYGKVVFSPGWIEIYFDGYGVACMEPGFGPIVAIEIDQDGPDSAYRPIIRAWGDINEEDPTHRIDMIDAADSNYQPKE
jgi:hypothetical protein